MTGLRVRYPDSPLCVCKIELGPPLGLETDCIRIQLDVVNAEAAETVGTPAPLALQRDTLSPVP